jgi:hypothetical protein
MRGPARRRVPGTTAALSAARRAGAGTGHRRDREHAARLDSKEIASDGVWHAFTSPTGLRGTGMAVRLRTADLRSGYGDRMVDDGLDLGIIGGAITLAHQIDVQRLHEELGGTVGPARPSSSPSTSSR